MSRPHTDNVALFDLIVNIKRKDTASALYNILVPYNINTFDGKNFHQDNFLKLALFKNLKIV